MAKRQEEEINAGEWLNTYADMVTLILTFFVLLFAMSTMTEQKYMQIVKAFTDDPDVVAQIEMMQSGGDEGDSPPSISGAQEEIEESGERLLDLDDVFRHLKDYSASHGLDNSIDIVQGEGYIFLRFKDNLLFEPDSSYIMPGGREVLSFLGDAILQVQDRLALIRIDGHTADVPDSVQSRVSDRILSTDRANAVLMFFEDVKGINSTKLMAVGHGKWRPISPNDSEENRSKNRRVELLITKTDSSSDALNEIYDIMNASD